MNNKFEEVRSSETMPVASDDLTDAQHEAIVLDGIQDNPIIESVSTPISDFMLYPPQETWQQASFPYPSQQIEQNFFPAPGMQVAPNINSYNVRPHNRNTLRNVILTVILVCVIAGIIFSLVIYQNVVSTQQAMLHLQVTTTANQHQMDTAQATSASVTATPSVNVPYPSYLPGRGVLAMYDPLNRPDNWQETDDGSCIFDDNGFHVKAPKNQLQTCFYKSDASVTTGLDMAFEVQMTFVKGDCGGLNFRASQGMGGGYANRFYYFLVCRNQTYGLYKYDDTGSVTTLKEGESTNISASSNGTDTLAVVAIGSGFALFVNSVHLADVQDSSYTDGSYGFSTGTNDSDCDVIFRDAKIWSL